MTLVDKKYGKYRIRTGQVSDKYWKRKTSELPRKNGKLFV